MHIKFYERNNKTYVRVAGDGLCYRICTRAVLTTAKQRVVKKQIQELHEQILNNEMQMKKLEYEYKSVQEKCMDLGNDRDRLQLEYDRLKESYETMSINAHAIENTKQSKLNFQTKK